MKITIRANEAGRLAFTIESEGYDDPEDTQYQVETIIKAASDIYRACFLGGAPKKEEEGGPDGV